MSKQEIQLGLFFPKAGKRPPGWIKYCDKVAVITFVKDVVRPKILLGHICSWPGSHGSGMDVDNIKRTIVWFDDAIRMADDADSAHEQGFDPQDPLLYKKEEIGLLSDLHVASEHFGDIYPINVVKEIVEAIKATDFNKLSPHEEFAGALERAGKAVRRGEEFGQSNADNAVLNARNTVSWWRRAQA